MKTKRFKPEQVSAILQDYDNGKDVSTISTLDNRPLKRDIEHQKRKNERNLDVEQP